MNELLTVAQLCRMCGSAVELRLFKVEQNGAFCTIEADTHPASVHAEFLKLLQKLRVVSIYPVGEGVLNVEVAAE